MKASGQGASYLSDLAIPSRRRYRRRSQQILPLRRQRRPLRGQIRQDPPPDVVLPLGMLVIHVVARLAVVLLARVASREHVLGAAQGALVHRLRHWCRRRLLVGRWSGWKFDDLVVGVTTIAGERGWR